MNKKILISKTLAPLCSISLTLTLLLSIVVFPKNVTAADRCPFTAPGGSCSAACGQYYKQGVATDGTQWQTVSCNCASGAHSYPATGSPAEYDVCCGYIDGSFCRATPPISPPGQPVTNDTFDALNPLTQFGDPAVSATLQTPAGVINRALTFAFPIAGLILFLMIVWGGFEMISGATNKKSMDQGKQRITAAVIGFLLLFVAYWLIKVVEAVFGVKII